VWLTREALKIDRTAPSSKSGSVFDATSSTAIELKMTEVERFEMTPHPVEFDMCYFAVIPRGVRSPVSPSNIAKRSLRSAFLLLVVSFRSYAMQIRAFRVI
jgi:uncharacterized membrane protein